MQRAGIPLLPKHHQVAHMTVDIHKKGNPRFYSCFLDETLNAMVAHIAQGVHPANFEEHIIGHVKLLARLLPESSHFF